MNASGCGVTVKDYGHVLRHDPAYADKARRIGELTKDVAELLPSLLPALRPRLRKGSGKLAWHSPCTLQHGQQLRGGVESILRALDELQRRVEKVKIPISRADELYRLRSHIELVRQSVTQA